jgi:eukaryotic-like serine/threonine-protein kinase
MLDNQKVQRKYFYFPLCFMILLVLVMFASSILIVSSMLDIHQQIAMAQTNVGFLTYENPTYRIKMQYPSNWILDNTVHGNTIASFSTPTKDGGVSIVVVANIIPAGMNNSTEKLAKFVISYSNQSDANLPGFKPVQVNTTNYFISGQPAFKMTFTMTSTPSEEPHEGKGMQVGIMSGGKMYLLIYTVDESKYDIYLPVVQKMFDSFQIITTS